MAWRRVANINEIQIGEIIKVYVDGEAVVLCRTETGFFAAEDRCSHMDLPLSDGLIKGEEIICIHHGAHFCLATGEACSPPAYEPILVYPTKIENEALYIDID